MLIISVIIYGSSEIDVLFDGKRENAMLEIKNLQLIEKLQNKMVDKIYL